MDEHAAAGREFAELAGRARQSDRVLSERARTLSDVPIDVAYDLQDALGAWFETHGHGAQVGYKIGATAVAMQRYLDVEHPVYGRVHAADVHESGSRIARAAGTAAAGEAAAAVAEALAPVALECELAVRLARELPARGAPWRREELDGFVDAVAPAIEIVENRYGDFRSTALGTLIADDMFHKRAVIGRWQPFDRAGNLAGVRGELRVDGGARERGTGADVLGHPLEAVAWLATELEGRGKRLRAGDFVLTGSMTLPLWIETLPARVTVRLSGIGGCACTLLVDGEGDLP